MEYTDRHFQLPSLRLCHGPFFARVLSSKVVTTCSCFPQPLAKAAPGVEQNLPPSFPESHVEKHQREEQALNFCPNWIPSPLLPIVFSICFPFWGAALPPPCREIDEAASTTPSRPWCSFPASWRGNPRLNFFLSERGSEGLKWGSCRVALWGLWGACPSLTTVGISSIPQKE